MPAGREVKNPNTIIEATIGEPETLDPAWAYDTASGEVIFNIYDTLIFFDREKVDQFVPKIAEQVPSFENGLVQDNGMTIIFPIRQGIKTHAGGTITPEDVEYSFERAMIQDRDGGPVWMLLEPLLGVETISELGDLTDPEDAANIGAMIDYAVEVDGNNVVFRLAKPYPLTVFLQILSQTWSSIVDKEAAIEHGAWPGNKDNWVEVFAKYHNPEEPELQEADCGSGPFMLERWEHGVEVSLVRFDDYWAGPAKIERAVIKSVDEWATRKLMFLQGDADIVYVPREYSAEVEGAEGIRVVRNLPTLQLDAVFFTFNVDPESPYLGSGQLDGNGIPPDFFSDINLRKAFAYSFDWDTYIEEVFLGEAKHVPGPIPEGLPFFNPEQETYTFDLAKAEEHFKAAWNGEVWEKGFTIEILYNTGNTARKTAAEMLKNNIESINPKFHIIVTEVDWPTYLRAMVRSQLPIFIIGWLADYPDPHNFVHPFMHSNGAFSAWQRYSNPTVDQLIERGITESDPDVRRNIYYQLQEIYYEEVPSFTLEQPLARHWERDWIQGWYYNPIYPGIYFYALSKGY
ncbi:ABC transporter substrate-binding protein [Candidatus Bathyarchaeota archaeon]|nr:ABC transporter substrate-binding protein [Candidatus Bathyarchaeota archaeon]